VLAYKYLQTLPHLASGDHNTFWVIPGELTQAVRAVTDAFGGHSRMGADNGQGADAGNNDGRRELTPGGPLSPGAPTAADEVAERAEAAVSEAKAEAAAAQGQPRQRHRTRTLRTDGP
jgi:hypothetical protein